jgi:hypothetical protein
LLRLQNYVKKAFPPYFPPKSSRTRRQTSNE